MKESLIDIFERVWENYNDFFTKTETDKEHYLTAKRKRTEVASEYASSLLALGNNWVEAVNNDVMSLAVPIHYPPSQKSKEKQKIFRDCVSVFLEDVGRAIYSLKKTELKKLKPLTRYLLGYDELTYMEIKEDLSRDEANSEYNRMKQKGLTDVCYFPTEISPAKYMVFGYNPQTHQEQASTPDQATGQASTQNQAPSLEELIKDKIIPTIAQTDKEFLMFGGALRKQYMYLENGSYHWNLSKSLLSFMCGYIYCGDRITEDGDGNRIYKKGYTQLPANDINKLFPDMNVDSNRNSLKKPPRNYWKIEDLIEDTKKALDIIKQKRLLKQPHI